MQLNFQPIRIHIPLALAIPAGALLVAAGLFDAARLAAAGVLGPWRWIGVVSFEIGLPALMLVWLIQTAGRPQVRVPRRIDRDQ